MFSSTLDFCNGCGTVLPEIDSETKILKCFCCTNSMNIKDFNSESQFSSIEFKKGSIMDGDDAKGPLADHECAKCNNPKMFFTTRQTRSADEGQTVFYTCPECGYTENEFS